MGDEDFLIVDERTLDFLAEQFGETDDGVERRAEFVVHAGEELALETVCALHFFGAQLEFPGKFLVEGTEALLCQFAFGDITDDGGDGKAIARFDC